MQSNDIGRLFYIRKTQREGKRLHVFIPKNINRW